MASKYRCVSPKKVRRSSGVRRRKARSSIARVGSTARRSSSSPRSVRDSSLLRRSPDILSIRRYPRLSSFFSAEFTVCLLRNSAPHSLVWVMGPWASPSRYSTQNTLSDRR